MPIARVKICGITRPEDAALAAEYGADAIGLNFISGRRQITPEHAVAIAQQTPPLCTIVALLFLDEQYMKAWSDGVPSLSALNIMVRFTVRQIYGLTVEALNQFRVKFQTLPDFKIAPDLFLPMSVSERASLASLKMRLAELRITPGAILLDTASTTALGGTGKTFNWNWIAEARDAGELDGLPPIILAGGLTPDNVAEAIRIARPYAVDVSSGIEVPGKPGIKDPIKMRDFIEAAKGA